MSLLLHAMHQGIIAIRDSRSNLYPSIMLEGFSRNLFSFFEVKAQGCLFDVCWFTDVGIPCIHTRYKLIWHSIFYVHERVNPLPIQK